MASLDHAQLARSLREHVIPLRGEQRDFESLMQLVGNARFVLIGEASHGTHDF
jgi:erythromycin esterase-like protein